MEKHRNRIVLGLGSNYHKEENMAEAKRLLAHRFPSLCFSEDELTEPVGSSLPMDCFLNCVALGTTEEELSVVQRGLKEMERSLGRTPEEKALGHIAIDIDLLQWNDLQLKPADLTCDYIQRGLSSLLTDKT